MRFTKNGSEREFDEVPNWRGFQDFAFLVEVGGIGDRGLPRGAPLGGARGSKACHPESAPPRIDSTAVCAETLHSMKVEKDFPALEDSFKGPGSWPSYKICGGGRNTEPRAQARQVEVLGRTPAATVVPAFSGSLQSCEEPVSIAPERLGCIQLAAEPKPRFHRNSAKPGVPSDSCAEPNVLM